MPHELKMTSSLLNHVKDAQSRYFAAQRERSLHKLKSEKEEKLKECNAEIADANHRIVLLAQTIQTLKKDAYELAFEAEKKTSLVELKSNALKRAAVEKQENLDKFVHQEKYLD